MSIIRRIATAFLPVPALWMGAFLWVLVSIPADAASRTWAASGDGKEIVVADCRDCGDDIGMMVVCRGADQPAEVIIHWGAVEKGQEGAVLPILLDIDGQAFKRQATTQYFGQIGYTPQFQMDRVDPLIAALQSGHNVRVTFSGQTTEISLRGSHRALGIFKSHCGWNRSAIPPDDGEQ